MAAQLPNYTSHPGRYLSLEHRIDAGDCQIFQFDERETEILRRLLAVIPKYYWVWELEGPVNTWDVGQIELWDTISSVVEELEEKLIMGCDTNSIIAALNNIATAGGGGGGGAGCYCGIPDDTVIPATPADPGDIATETVPDGFDGTWSQYDTHKCKAANKITDDFIATLYGAATISGLVTGMSAGLAYLVIAAAWTGTGSSLLASGILGLIGLGLSAPYVIAGLVVACVALFAFGGAGLGYLASVADAVDADKENFVCALYSADSVDAAQSALAGLLDSYYDVGWSEPLRDLLDTITLSLLSVATLNTLFEDNEDVAAYTSGTVNCGTDCDDGWCVECTIGTGDDIVKGVATQITAAWVAGPNKYYIQVGQACDCVDYTVTITGCNRSSGWTGGAVANCAVENQWYWTSQSNPNGVYTAAALQSFSSSGTFYLTVKYEDV